MDAPDASDVKVIIEDGDDVFGQFCQRDVPDFGEDVTVDQIAVSAHGAAVPSSLIVTKPAVAPLAYCVVVFFLHIVISFWQTNNTTERGKYPLERTEFF